MAEDSTMVASAGTSTFDAGTEQSVRDLRARFRLKVNVDMLHAGTTHGRTVQRDSHTPTYLSVYNS